MFHYNDISRNKGDYTLIKQWNYAGNYDNGCKFNNILYPWKFFSFLFFFIARKIREIMRKNWEAFISHLYSRNSKDVMGMLSTF